MFVADRFDHVRDIQRLKRQRLFRNQAQRDGHGIVLNIAAASQVSNARRMILETGLAFGFEHVQFCFPAQLQYKVIHILGRNDRRILHANQVIVYANEWTIARAQMQVRGLFRLHNLD